MGDFLKLVEAKMNQIPLDFIIIFAVFLTLIIFLTSSGIFLIKRGGIKRSKTHLYLGLFFLSFSFMVFSLMAQSFGLEYSWVICAAVVQITIFLAINFIRSTFYLKGQGWFRFILMLCVSIGILNFVFAFYYDLPQSYILGRIGFTIATDIQFIIVGAWQIWLSIRDYKRIINTSAADTIKTRYLQFTINSFLMPGFSLIDLFGTLFEIYLGFDYKIAVFMILIVAFSYCLQNFLIWVVFQKEFPLRLPSEVKQTIAKFISENEIDDLPLETVLPTNIVMDVISYFGEVLSIKINKTPASCKGLIYLAISGDLGNEGIYKLTFRKFLKVLKHGLNERLTSLNIQGVDQITDEMTEEAEKNKSMFTIAQV